MSENKKYKFQTLKKNGKIDKTYFKSEHELNHEEIDILYQGFAQQWDFVPMAVKNRFMKWLRQSLQEHQDNINSQL